MIFGEAHPYGQVIESPFVLDRIHREELQSFYKEQYLGQGGITIFISGRTEPWMLNALDEEIGGIAEAKGEDPPYKVPPADPSAPAEHWVKKEGALQAAIRVGKPLFGRDHPDFPGMVILSTLLGGYFGSRLMMNLREDKGYTYGVGCASIALQDSGFFAIATEVGTQVREAAIEEIRKEVRRLSDEPVAAEELEHVRRYMEGSFLSSADGPFAQADLFKNVHRAGLDLSYYDKLMETLHNITPEELQGLAQKHLREEDLRTVIAGDPKEA
ncbi:MAG: M16 family metallopeptidase [Flavobacteriales bacterium]